MSRREKAWRVIPAMSEWVEEEEVGDRGNDEAVMLMVVFMMLG